MHVADSNEVRMMLFIMLHQEESHNGSVLASENQR